MSLRVVVTGGRHYQNAAEVQWALGSLHATYTISTLIHGRGDPADYGRAQGYE